MANILTYISSNSYKVVTLFQSSHLSFPHTTGEKRSRDLLKVTEPMLGLAEVSMCKILGSLISTAETIYKGSCVISLVGEQSLPSPNFVIEIILN